MSAHTLTSTANFHNLNKGESCKASDMLFSNAYRLYIVYDLCIQLKHRTGTYVPPSTALLQTIDLDDIDYDDLPSLEEVDSDEDDLPPLIASTCSCEQRPRAKM
ncbi:hypothetical protein DFH09DRAFT_1306986 [Mycena vulgaris]|nr:hypothetical protein DFH09DRAFT_1306986 [Mycena vulgaris]